MMPMMRERARSFPLRAEASSRRSIDAAWVDRSSPPSRGLPAQFAFARLRMRPLNCGHGCFASPRWTQSRAARSGDRAPGSLPRACRRRFGQDARADAPDRLAARGRSRFAVGGARGHVHEQGGRRDARAHRKPDRERRARAHGRHVPRHRASAAAPALARGAAARDVPDPRRRRSAAARQAHDPGHGPGRGALSAAPGDLVHQQREGRRQAPRCAARRLQPGQRDADRHLSRVRGRVPARGAGRFRRAAAARARIVAAERCLAAALPRAFRHLLIDEFQDTNTLQYAWIRVLAGTTGQVFVVGDDDQAIYGWRGARVENVQDFLRDFPSARTIRLEQNYRSTGNILAAANAVIAHNPDRLGKELWTSGAAGTPIEVYAAYNEQDEARYVIERIREYIAGDSKPSDVADAVPLERAIAQLRRAADPARHRVSRLRGAALLRSRRDQGCAGVPSARREPARRCRVRARGEHAAARHRRAHDRFAAPARAARRRVVVGSLARGACDRYARRPREECAACVPATDRHALARLPQPSSSRRRPRPRFSADAARGAGAGSRPSPG